MANDINVSLVKAKFGLGGEMHDMVMRHQTMNILPDQVDKLLEARISGTGYVVPSVINEVSAKVGCVVNQPTGTAYIDGAGWGSRRGLGELVFDISANQIREERLIVVGYISGGTVDPVQGISSDAMFVPIKTWTQVKTQVTDGQGYPVTAAGITSTGQFTMNDPTITGGLISIRPRDMIDNVVGLTASEDANQGIAGGMSEYMGSSGSILAASGCVMSRSDNLNSVNYAETLLKSAMGVKQGMDTTQNRYNVIGTVARNTGLAETSIENNPFMIAMRQVLGRTGLAGFEGWSIGELCHVFPNFADTMNMEMMDPARNTPVDNRIESSAMGTALPEESIAHDLANLMLYVLFESRLMYFDFSASNNVDPVVSLDPNAVQVTQGSFLSLIDNNPTTIQDVENAKELIKQMFFTKYAGDYQYQKQIVEVNVQSYLYGRTVVQVAINGNYQNARTVNMATYASSRWAPTVVNKMHAGQEVKNFFTNLTNQFSFEGNH